MEVKLRRPDSKLADVSGLRIDPENRTSPANSNSLQHADNQKLNKNSNLPDLTFIPNRAASWWCTIEDLQWSQKKIIDKIKRRPKLLQKPG